MDNKYCEVQKIESRDLYDEMHSYVESLINEATNIGALEPQDVINDYTIEIGRIGNLCADYETDFMEFKNIKFKSPLILSIERELEKRSIKQNQAAELLDVKESTLSQIMTGKRQVSMRMAKKLYNVLDIDPGLIIKFA